MVLINDITDLKSLLPAVALLTSFALSLTVALVYKMITRGVPHVQVRTFPQTLAISGIVSAIVVLSIGDNIARGIGLVGALTVIRFRSNLQDPRDLIFAFAALATGVAMGAYAFQVGIIGTMIFLLAAILVSRPWFTSRQTFNALLSFQFGEGEGESPQISQLLRTRCHEFNLVRVRQSSPGWQEHAYQIRLKQPDQQEALIRELQHVRGIQDALLVAYDGRTDV